MLFSHLGNITDKGERFHGFLANLLFSLCLTEFYGEILKLKAQLPSLAVAFSEGSHDSLSPSLLASSSPEA